MAEKSVMTGKEYDELKSSPGAELRQGREIRRGSLGERLSNAALSGAVQGAGFLPELVMKGAATLASPMTKKNYNFGSATEGALQYLRNKGLLTDQNLEAASGPQSYGEEAVRYGASGLTGGVPVRALVGAASRNMPKAFGGPGAKNVAKSLGLYDVAFPALTGVAGKYVEQGLGAEGGRLPTEVATSLVLPTVGALSKGAKIVPGHTGRNEKAALQQLQKLGIEPKNIRPDANLNLPTFAIGYPELPPTASVLEQAKQATNKGEALRRATSSALGQNALRQQMRENPQAISEMLAAPTGPAPSLVPAAERQVQGSTSGVRQSFERPRDVATNEFGQEILSLVSKAQDRKNDLYAQLGDARKLGTVDAAPLRKAMDDVLGTFESSAMSSGTLAGTNSIQRGGIKEELQKILQKNMDLTDAKQAANDALAMQQWEKEAERARSLLLPEPPKPKPTAVTPENAPDKVSAKSMMQMYKDINALWQNATPSERFLLSKLKSGVNETLEQNPAVADAFKKASENNAEFMWLARKGQGNTSPLLKALDSRDPETALQDYMKSVVSGQTTASEDGRRLAKLAEDFGDKDRFKSLALNAIEDQAAQQAFKSSYRNEGEIVSAAKTARSFIDKTSDFASSLGIHPKELEARTEGINRAVNQAETAGQQFNQMRENPSAYFDSILNQSPSQQRETAGLLNAMAQGDEATAAAIRDGMTEAIRRKFSGQGGNFQHGAAAEFLSNPESATLTDFLAPEVRDRVIAASRAQSELERMRPNPLSGEISEGLQNTATANAAALAGSAIPGATPGMGYRIARFMEGIPLRPGRAEREAIVSKALVDPNYAMEIAARNPDWQVRLKNQALPAIALTPQRTFMDRGLQFQTAQPETTPTSETSKEDWSFEDDETKPESTPTSETSKEDWSFEDEDVKPASK